MALCVQIDTNGSLVLPATSAEECTGFVLLDATEYGALVSPLEIDPATVAVWYAFGFGAVVIPWATAYAVRVALRVIKLL